MFRQAVYRVFFYSYEADSTFLQLEEGRPYIEVTTVH